MGALPACVAILALAVRSAASILVSMLYVVPAAWDRGWQSEHAGFTYGLRH
jgi:hypothetical protein